MSIHELNKSENPNKKLSLMGKSTSYYSSKNVSLINIGYIYIYNLGSPTITIMRQIISFIINHQIGDINEKNRSISIIHIILFKR